MICAPCSLAQHHQCTQQLCNCDCNKLKPIYTKKVR
jgi:hypothetical protein